MSFDNDKLFTVDDADAEAEEVLNDLNRLVEDADDILNLNDSQRQQEGDWNQHGELNEICVHFFSKSKQKTNPKHPITHFPRF
jgi:hypothetical protein